MFKILRPPHHRWPGSQIGRLDEGPTYGDCLQVSSGSCDDNWSRGRRVPLRSEGYIINKLFVQSGITIMLIRSNIHHVAVELCGRGANRVEGSLTVDGDGHALVQDVAILTLEGRDLAKLVELQVVGRGVGGIDLDDLKVEIVGLRHGADGRGARVVLSRGVWVSSLRLLMFDENLKCDQCLPRRCTAYRRPSLL